MDTIRRLATKPWVVMPLVAVLALGGWFAWHSRSSGGTAAAATTEQIVDVTTGAMSKTVTAEGTVAVADTDDLSFSAAGTVTAVNVVAGQTVEAGDVLATIDSVALESAVADAETTVAEAQAKLSDDTSAGSSSAQLAADQSSLVSAQDKLDAANEDLAGAQLVATFDGTVATVDLAVGEELSATGSGGTDLTGTGTGSGQSSGNLGGSSATSGGTGSGATSGTGASTSTAQISVVSASTFTVDLGFDDTEIAELAIGQEASISLSTATSSPVAGGATRSAAKR